MTQEEELLSILHGNVPAGLSWAYSLTYKNLAYLCLVKIGELDDTQFYNIRTKKYHDSDTCNFDMGFKGQNTFRYSDGKWRYITQK